MNKGSIALGILVGFVACKAAEQYHRQRQDVYNSSKEDIVDGVAGLIGNTPLMRIQSLSEATGCEILAKAEFLNPGGSPKDRVALSSMFNENPTLLLTSSRQSCRSLEVDPSTHRKHNI